MLLLVLLALPLCDAGGQPGPAATCAGTDGECQEQSEDQQSLLQARGGARGQRHALNASADGATYYDCDGDGKNDCGKFNYAYNQCGNPAQCKRYPLEGCQCRRCNDQGKAFGDKSLKQDKPNTKYYGKWMNWADEIDTCAPWLMPKDDKALKDLLAYAVKKGYKVRPSGSTHTAGGLVTDGSDPSTMVVSLAEYTAPSDWEFKWLTMKDGSKRVRVNAGWNQMQLYAKIRPEGYFLPTQTAGYYFQLAGILSNTVHGSVYSQGFVHEALKAVRVMLSDGTIQILTSESDLHFWRNSFGLLGFILGVELEVVPRKKFQVYTTQRLLPKWSPKEFWKFVKDDASADLPQSVGAYIPESKREALGGEFFINFLEDPPRVLAVVKRADENATVPGVCYHVPPKAEANYEDMLTQKKFSMAHGFASYNESVRREGAPPISVPNLPIVNIPIDKILQLLPDSNRTFSIQVAQALAAAAFAEGAGVPAKVAKLRALVNDGFIITETPRAVYSAYFFPAGDAYEALDIIRGVVRKSLEAKEGFLWNLPSEFRFVNVNDDAFLQPVKPGLYAVVESVAFPGTAKDQQEYLRALYEVQEALEKRFGKVHPHIAKMFGMVERDGRIVPFDPSRTCSLYTDEQKYEFNGYRFTFDPEGVFDQGLGVDLLSDCP